MAERVSFRGGLTCSCVVESLPWVEFELQLRGLGKPVIFQLGYRGDVSASAGTHNRGGCVDLDGTPTAAEIDVWRLWGWTQQARYLSGVKPHCHGWPYKCSHLSPAAKSQERDWNRKDAGLQGGAQVQGRWPVKPWHIALRERKVAIADEIADQVKKELLSDDFVQKFAAKFLTRDNIIPNEISGDPANKFLTPRGQALEVQRALNALKGKTV